MFADSFEAFSILKYYVSHPDAMPLLNQTYVAFLGVIVIIILGIVVEKKKVVWENVFGNIMSFILVMASIDMSIFLTIGFLVYLILGIAAVYYKANRFYFLFGFKTYGALSMTLLLAAEGYFGMSVVTTTMNSIVRFLAVWVALAVVINIIGFIYSRTR